MEIDIKSILLSSPYVVTSFNVYIPYIITMVVAAGVTSDIIVVIKTKSKKLPYFFRVQCCSMHMS